MRPLAEAARLNQTRILWIPEELRVAGKLAPQGFAFLVYPVCLVAEHERHALFSSFDLFVFLCKRAQDYATRNTYAPRTRDQSWGSARSLHSLGFETLAHSV